ncbi:MAG: serine hydrolase domain-containing protein [Rhodococcus sp. (in: high G+C Gram-positive bacteria)]|jgi:CubicO group peptidase (beta-lactamase class C family)|uniref:serine hydrolase domain-containing protein n=1 Tax=Rhodococcus sp. EPR-157 TaxID=1813677 RepID=UPI0007BBABBF|nr:serine hydrolase domain-containing protein [Rhodococcus sp. EPR-157]KZF03705.1 hypothetical protein A2J03_07180 [Rhodococcus sp. EPR-157]
MTDLADVAHRLARSHGVTNFQLAARIRGRDYSAAAGPSSGLESAPVDNESAYPIGSVTKAVTATAIMVLVQEGDLELDEPLADILPELRSASWPALGAVTVERVLSHTAGFASSVTIDDARATDRARWISTYARHHDLALVPGTAFSYSNIGYVLAGRVLEAVTGMPWHIAVTELVLRPVGVKPGFVLHESTRPTVSGHVTTNSGRTVPITTTSLIGVEEPAGGLTASAQDMVRIAEAAFIGNGHDLLDAATRASLCRDRTGDSITGPFGLADGWGMGWARYENGDATSVWMGHDGNSEGTSSHIRINPVTGDVVALNTGSSSGTQMWADLITEQTVAGMPHSGTSLAPSRGPRAHPRASAECVGVFRNGGDTVTVAARDDGRLDLGLTGEDRVLIELWEDLTFLLDRESDGRTGPGDRGRFLRSASSKITHVQFSGRLAARTAEWIR